MKQKARTSSERIKDNELTNYAQHIVSNMTTNPIYPDPKPTLGVRSEERRVGKEC